MKLITRYNRYILPALGILFLLCIIACYFLIRQVLQNELDEIILRTKIRIENYVHTNRKLPVISSFNDQQIQFEGLSSPFNKSEFSTTKQFIPEQNKNHTARTMVFGLMLNNIPYKVVITQPLEGTRHLTIIIVKIAIVTTASIFILLILINKRVLSKIWFPFYESLDKIKSFKVHEQQVTEFPETPIEEFNQMNTHFKAAAANATRDYKNLREFSENASHEIQTPLAIIRSNIEMMIQLESLTEKQSELFQSIYSSVTKISKLQQSLLLLTKIDNHQFHPKNYVALISEINSKALQFQEIWQTKRLHYSLTTSAATININNELLDILLNNLFTNATYHNVPGGEIAIFCEKGRFEIANSGMEEALDQDRIFRRFYKNSAHGESNGLGLSIVQQICTTSNIEISYRFQEERHRFILTW
jgi:signal transduction histidine kinase